MPYYQPEDDFCDAYYEARTELPNSDFLFEEPQIIDVDDDEYIRLLEEQEEAEERRADAMLDEGEFDWQRGGRCGNWYAE